MSVLCGGTVSPSTVERGNAFSITVQSTNDGFLSDEFRYNVFAMPDGEYLGEIDHGTLASGESETTTESFIADLDPGDYDIEIQDAVGSEVDATGVCGTLTVEEAESEFNPSVVEATGCVNLPGTASPGETATVGVVVDNPNPVPAQVDTIVFTPAQTLGTRNSVDVPADGSREISVTITAPSEGSYQVDAEVSGVEEGSSIGLAPQALGSQQNRETLALAALGVGSGLAAAFLR